MHGHLFRPVLRNIFSVMHPCGRRRACEVLTATNGQRALILQCLDRPTENALAVVKFGGKTGEGIIGFLPITNSIFVFRLQTTVQSFIKFDSKNATTGVMTDRRHQSYELSNPML